MAEIKIFDKCWHCERKLEVQDVHWIHGYTICKPCLGKLGDSYDSVFQSKYLACCFCKNKAKVSKMEHHDQSTSKEFRIGDYLCIDCHVLWLLDELPSKRITP